MRIKMRILAVALLIAASPLASAATVAEVDAQVKLLDTTAANKGQTQVADKIAAFFTNLAGSKENAVALVTALRNGSDVTLKTPATGTGTGTGTGSSTTTTFTPPTGKMGWGNVKISLGLAQDSLLQAGITKPTAAQLQTALLGGTITKADGTSVVLKGVLQMRADGMGWGQIAHAGNTNVGPVVSSLKTTQAQLAKLPPAASGATTPTTPTSAAATASTRAASSGITTASGSPSAQQPQGNAYGRGIVTAAGGSAGTSVAASASGKPNAAGAGVVNAAGGNASAVTTAQANAGGNGNGKGQGQGKGKGG